MTFQPVLSEELKKVLSKLAARDTVLATSVNKKIKQICSCDEELINHYKNLRHDLSEYKRVHVERSYVLLFKVDFEKKLVLFTKLDHHDRVYKR
jgi:YafQ family addiction module toxin component